MSLVSPTMAYPPEIERDDAATNALYAVSMLQNVGLNTLYDRARNSESMLLSYHRSFERRPKVYMARTKGSVQRERDSDNNRRTAEHSQAKPKKKGRCRRSPRPLQYVCYFCDKVNKQRVNDKRHMVMKHACRLDGTAATAEDITQARAWASKEQVNRSQQFKSREYVPTDSDSDSSESTSSSSHIARSPTRQSGRTDHSSSGSSSRSSSPVTTAPPKVRKVRFELDEPVRDQTEPDRARKRSVKPSPSTSKTPSPVPSILEMNIPVPSPTKIAKAQRSKKPPVTVRSEVHTATKPPTTRKKVAKSPAMTEARTEAVTPKKRLVIETPRLSQMVQVAKKAVQNLKDKKEFQLPDPEVYRPTFGPVPKRSKAGQVKGTSTVTGKGKANVATSTPTSAKGQPSTDATSMLTPIPETPVTSTAELSLEEAQNQANETLVDQERSVAQLRVDLELSSDTSGEGNKVKAKTAQQPTLSDVEPSSDEAEAPAQKFKENQGLPGDQPMGVPEILADYDQSIIISEEDTPVVISEEEGSTKQPIPSTSTSEPPVTSWMTIPAPVSLTDIHIPLRKPCRPSKQLNPIGKLKAELSSPEPIPRAPKTKQHARKRTKKVTSMHLANASLNFRRCAGEIADDFAVSYQLTPDEKYQVQHELTKMRLAQKVLALRMRAQFPPVRDFSTTFTVPLRRSLPTSRTPTTILRSLWSSDARQKCRHGISQQRSNILSTHTIPYP